MDDDSAIRLRRIILRLARQLNTSSTGAGLTPSQASLLGIIVGNGRMSLSELAEIERLNPTMLSRVVGKLQELGFIDRIPDPADLRSASVVSTAARRPYRPCTHDGGPQQEVTAAHTPRAQAPDQQRFRQLSVKPSGCLRPSGDQGIGRSCVVFGDPALAAPGDVVAEPLADGDAQVAGQRGDG